ncbi:hypothetical protein PR048_023535 [Dryococelus australis]|uniref:Uncharacterized protein n=1 Tax=Dryococelus australis TaxID=614101 RepID=A0ABQ9GUF2_9NEOP|nr:hypothetical protein PR048_023535 [Dryococelus australis]
MVQITKEMLKRIKGSDLAQKIARLLLTQHVAPNATTGSSPVELLMGRCLWTCLNRVHPDLTQEMIDRQKSERMQTAPRRFVLQDLVYTQNMGQGLKWLEAIVVETVGLISCSPCNPITSPVEKEQEWRLDSEVGDERYGKYSKQFCKVLAVLKVVLE